MQDGAHFIELVTKQRGARRSVLLQSDGEGTDEEQAMAYVVRAVNGFGSSEALLDAVARLAEAVPLGKVRRATSKEIEQTGAAVDAVLAAYRQVRRAERLR
jgi:hypothetical protein